MATAASAAALRPSAPAGSKPASQFGSGCAPTIESTTILSGSGVSNVNGAASRLNRNSAPMCGQNGRASTSNRRYSAASESLRAVWLMARL